MRGSATLLELLFESFPVSFFEGLVLGVLSRESLPLTISLLKFVLYSINKEMDYVNGTGGTVLGVRRTGLRVRTDTGFIIMVSPCTDREAPSVLPDPPWLCPNLDEDPGRDTQAPDHVSRCGKCRGLSCRHAFGASPRQETGMGKHRRTRDRCKEENVRINNLVQHFPSEAAGYVALSRDEYERSWQLVGQLTRHHFTPATQV